MREETHQIMISSLTLLNGWIQTNNEKSLTAIFMREKKNSQNRTHRDFVIESFSVQLEKRREHLDVISTPVSRHLNSIFLFITHYDFHYIDNY